MTRALLMLAAAALFANACSIKTTNPDAKVATAVSATAAAATAQAGGPATGVLARAQAALDAAGAYTIDVTATNFVLPQWGGSDGGVVEVNAAIPVARARLKRTGEGSYTVLLVDNQTFFERTTCETFARIPGGGRNVLEPFIIARNGRLASAQAVQPPLTSAAGIIVAANLEWLGPVTITLDAATMLPLTIEQQSAAPHAVWAFRDWGKSVDVERPAGPIADRGPGGDPC
ncbi:MAG: hypothetical protein HYX53_07605 [Chloroflexi bacterium]|nr:hypothetical protein [Chloroflexota bacterium]